VIGIGRVIIIGIGGDRGCRPGWKFTSRLAIVHCWVAIEMLTIRYGRFVRKRWFAMTADFRLRHRKSAEKPNIAL